MKNIKLLISVACLTYAASITAQVKYSIDLLADEETYMVSLVSETTIASPLNLSSNIQVILKSAIDEPLNAVQIESQIEGVDWVNNAYMDEDNANAAFTLNAIVMAQASTKAISFEADETVPLFTFKNGYGTCLTSIELPSNNDLIIKSACDKGLNFTQNITTLFARGNAITGINKSTAVCKSLEPIDPENYGFAYDLKAYPVPTNNQLTIEWTNPVEYTNVSLGIFNEVGKRIQLTNVDQSIGTKTATVNTKEFSSGVYSFVIKNDQRISAERKFVVIQ